MQNSQKQPGMCSPLVFVSIDCALQATNDALLAMTMGLRVTAVVTIGDVRKLIFAEMPVRLFFQGQLGISQQVMHLGCCHEFSDAEREDVSEEFVAMSFKQP
jgi:hypothetical protein